MYPDTDAYKNRTESYFSVSSQLEPYCIAQPTSADEVSLVLKTLIDSTDCELAVRSGGHTVWPANNSECVGLYCWISGLIHAQSTMALQSTWVSVIACRSESI